MIPTNFHIMLRSGVLVALVGCYCLLTSSAEASGDAEQEYQRLFAKGGWLASFSAGQPLETLRELQNLAILLEGKQDDVSKARLAEVKKLVKFNDINKCDSEIAQELDDSIGNYDFPTEEIPRIRGYLENCRNKLFAICSPFLNQILQAALDSFARRSNSPQILRFQKFIASNTNELPRLTPARYIKGELLYYIAKEFGERRLDPKMTREEFAWKFNATLKQVCLDIKEETRFTFDYSMFFKSKQICGQMDSRLRDLYRMRLVCLDLYAHPNKFPQDLYTKLAHS